MCLLHVIPLGDYSGSVAIVSLTEHRLLLMNPEEIISAARSIVSAEIDAIQRTSDGFGDAFVRACHMVANSQSKIVFTGIGKSALVAAKLAATFASLRIPSCYMHAADGLHGDLGMIVAGDIVILLSLSGENFELSANAAAIANIGAMTVCMTGNPTSSLARGCDLVLKLDVPKEAGDLGVAPTASTAAMMALGDALGLVAARMRGLTIEEFARFHPGGALGRRLLTRVKDLVHPEGRVAPSSTLLDVVAELSRSRLGAVAVLDPNDGTHLVGLITEGDFRRAVAASPDRFGSMTAAEIMTKAPVVMDGEVLAFEALRAMEGESVKVSVVPVVAHQGKYVGILRLHDLLSFS